MIKLLTIAQLISAILLIAVILMQQRGAGLGGIFGGSGDVYRSKRGIEKTLYIVTIFFSGYISWLGISSLNVLKTN